MIRPGVALQQISLTLYSCDLFFQLSQLLLKSNIMILKTFRNFGSCFIIT